MFNDYATISNEHYTFWEIFWYLLNGGQEAPLAPLYHQALAIRDKKYPVAVVNCGGIANITFII